MEYKPILIDVCLSFLYHTASKECKHEWSFILEFVVKSTAITLVALI